MIAPQTTDQNRRRLGWIIAAVFALAMIMGTGPGVMLVNNPEKQWFNLPVIYVWGLCWYAVQLVCVVTVYAKVWTDDE